MDKDKNGSLSLEELQEGLNKHCTPQFLPNHRHQTDKGDTDHIMSQLDLDGDGKLDYNEFLQGAVNHYSLLSKANIEHMFQLFDADKDG